MLYALRNRNLRYAPHIPHSLIRRWLYITHFTIIMFLFFFTFSRPNYEWEWNQLKQNFEKKYIFQFLLILCREFISKNYEMRKAIRNVRWRPYDVRLVRIGGVLSVITWIVQRQTFIVRLHKYLSAAHFPSGTWTRARARVAHSLRFHFTFSPFSLHHFASMWLNCLQIKYFIFNFQLKLWTLDDDGMHHARIVNRQWNEDNHFLRIIIQLHIYEFHYSEDAVVSRAIAIALCAHRSLFESLCFPLPMRAVILEPLPVRQNILK